MIAASVAGLLTGLSLIVAIGAQNAYVLRQGLRQDHVGAIVFICTASDLVLIAGGVSGVGAIVDHARWTLDAVRWFGVAFLVTYAVATLRRARHTTGMPTSTETGRRVIGRAVALTWLNPHVYLDTVLLLGSIANTHGMSGRWWFGLGASVASTLWFSVLGFGARRLAPLLATPRAWQLLDGAVAATMLFVAVRLAI